MRHRTAVVTITITKVIPPSSATTPTSELTSLVRAADAAFDIGNLVNALGEELTVQTTFTVETTEES